ncbi:LOW QUALITY PROTEIN: putative cytoplasmic protein [Psychrobacter sp. JCM 18902]|nr:LOW QUALITY PROTEIN: putative cytoplasmic protein [Psychrobacter sp. JCM 18902]
MSHTVASNPIIPSHWKIKRSTHFFTKDKVPKALLTHHNTAEAYTAKFVSCKARPFMALLMKPLLNLKKPLLLKQGSFAVSPPQYWHRVELSDDAQFNINFWTEADTGNKSLFNSSKIHSKPIEKLFDQSDES